ncbi:hypothetical protein KY344_03770 [Candidatus Woesearchaeota archaeon]|nr:hypothetical protein [Candidatus Woesearchaeota archaeon]
MKGKTNERDTGQSTEQEDEKDVPKDEEGHQGRSSVVALEEDGQATRPGRGDC